MKFINLTRGFVARIDDCDLDAASRHSWYAATIKGLTYAVATVAGYQVRLHRLLLDAPRGALVDHRNGDTLDCRRENIRIATAAQNAQNRRSTSRRPTPFKGVAYFEGKLNHFGAYICVSRRHVHLGVFSTADAAAHAYDDAARRAYGSFATVNFPRPGERSALTGLVAPPLVASSTNTFPETLF